MNMNAGGNPEASYALQESNLLEIRLAYYTRKKITTVLRSVQGMDQVPGSETPFLQAPHHDEELHPLWWAGPSIPCHLFEPMAGLGPDTPGIARQEKTQHKQGHQPRRETKHR